MKIGQKLVESFGYAPMIKFTGPRANLPPPSSLPPLPKLQQKIQQQQHESVKFVSSQSSILIPSYRFPALTEEQIQLINSGGAYDPPVAKKPPKK